MVFFLKNLFQILTVIQIRKTLRDTKGWVIYKTGKTAFEHTPNTEENIENTMRREVFLTNLEVFGNVVKQVS